jgi:hypothetical protein
MALRRYCGTFNVVAASFKERPLSSLALRHFSATAPNRSVDSTSTPYASANSMTRSPMSVRRTAASCPTSGSFKIKVCLSFLIGPAGSARGDTPVDTSPLPVMQRCGCECIHTESACVACNSTRRRTTALRGRATAARSGAVERSPAAACYTASLLPLARKFPSRMLAS